MNKSLQATIFILLAYQCNLVLNQRLEIAKCADYKKDIFEEIKTFSFYMHGADEWRFTVDHCKQWTPFIVDGTPANPKEFPMMARLGNADEGRETTWFCGGSLVSEKYVMTAAHCFYSRNGEVNRVRLGELDFSTDKDDAKPEDFNVRRYIPHPDYVDSSSYHDIGLIELDRPVTLNRYKVPGCLPINAGDEFTSFIATGWGSTRFAGDSSPMLLKVNLNRFSADRCRQFTDNGLIDKFEAGLDDRMQLCAGSDSAKDTCNGDSGGPLLAYHPDYPCMYFVVGITSTGVASCGLRNTPGIYTRVFNYMDWINGIVWK